MIGRCGILDCLIIFLIIFCGHIGYLKIEQIEENEYKISLGYWVSWENTIYDGYENSPTILIQLKKSGTLNEVKKFAEIEYKKRMVPLLLNWNAEKEYLMRKEIEQ